VVHVCQRWQNVVFASLQHLELRLHCIGIRSVRDMLDIWLEFPIIIDGLNDVDNVIAALKWNDCMSQITCLNLSSSELERVVEAMQDPFPTLTHLWLQSTDRMALVIPDSFLGGFALSLRSFWLESIAFLALPKLLSSATNLVYLDLKDLLHSRYISPLVIAACLSTLTRLKSLTLGFKSP